MYAIFFLDLWLDGQGNPGVKGLPKLGIEPGALNCQSTVLTIRTVVVGENLEYNKNALPHLNPQ